jgi:hypothetical protein
VSDNPLLPKKSDTSYQADQEAARTTAVGRRRMATALLHGRSRSWVDGRRHWPALLAGVVATGLIAAGVGIAEAYQDQKSVDSGEGDVAPADPVETTEPTATPTTPTPSSPATPPTQPSAPVTKKPATPDKPSARPPRDKAGSKPGRRQGGSDQPSHDKPGTAKGDSTPKIADKPKTGAGNGR